MPRTYGQSFLFKKFNEYEKKLMEFIMESEEIDTSDKKFDDIRFEVKRRQISNALVRVMDSDNVVLLMGRDALPKSFKVFAAKDIRKDHKLKVFIDCTSILKVTEDGIYKCPNIDYMISYLTDAMITLIYYADEKKITNNYDLTNTGTKCFAMLFTNIIDYLYKVSVSPDVKSKIMYYASSYYLTGILGREANSTIINVAKRFADIPDRDAEACDYAISSMNMFESIDTFVTKLGEIFGWKLTTDMVVEKWMYLYGTGTVFGLELFPDFASMLIDTYVGAYLNNQKTIEKITGRNMVEFVKTALKIGETMR